MNVARYHRVSTDTQTLERQHESTSSYIDREWPDADVQTYTDASTGTDTARDGYRDMMAAVENDEIDVVVVHEVSRISRSVRDLERTVDRLQDAETALHVVSEGLRFTAGEDSDPYQTALLQLLGVFAELEANMTRKRVKEGIAARQANDDYHHGPAPLGFEKDEGRLIEAENYHDVVAALDMVQKDELSKRKAAQRLDCSRSTISRALERSELYGV